MPRKQDRNLVVGLDIGRSKVVAIVGELCHDGTIEVVGVGSHPSRGLKRGVVVNIDSTVQSIQRAVEEAELMAGCQIHSNRRSCIEIISAKHSKCWTWRFDGVVWINVAHIEAHSGQRTSLQQRVRDVVGIAEVREPEPVQRPEVLADGHQVGERLAR